MPTPWTDQVHMIVVESGLAQWIGTIWPLKCSSSVLFSVKGRR